MKYYVYTSATKVEMLYPQIPPRLLSRFATELKIDLKLLSATVRGREPEHTLYSKLALVVRYIEEHEQVGTIDEPKDWFRGTLPMRWGRWPFRTDDVVFFSGATELTALGLAGSRAHVVGNRRDPDAEFESRSNLDSLFAALHPHLPELGFERVRQKELATEAEYLREYPEWPSPAAAVDAAALDAVVVALDNPMRDAVSNTKLRVSPQPMEFMARKLLDGLGDPDRGIGNHRRREPRVLLGTPLYVAQAGEPEGTVERVPDEHSQFVIRPTNAAWWERFRARQRRG